MGIGYFLQFGFAQHALEAAFLVAVSCGLIGPFVITRTMSFAVHGTSELAFTGAVGGLLVADNPLVGALVGALVGPTALRLKGFYLGIVSLALVFIGNYVFINLPN